MDSDQNNKSQKSGLQNAFAKNPKWEAESKLIRKVQISLDFPDSDDILLRIFAARQHKAPSSLVREILGMPTSPPKRARIGVSFNDEELLMLGERYHIDPEDKAAIRRHVTEEVTQLLALMAKESQTARPKSKTTTTGNTKDKGIQAIRLPSDGIYERFQQALKKRNAVQKDNSSLDE